MTLCITLGMLLCGQGLVHANELPSVVSFIGGGDADGNKDSTLDLDYGFKSESRLILSLASNRSNSQDDPVTTRTTLLGFRSDPLEKISAGIDLESWGVKDTLTTGTLRLVFDISLENWLISLRPQWRTLTFTTDCVVLIIANCDPEVKVHSTGTAVDVGYYTDGPWGFSLGYAKHQYDRKIENLWQYPVFQFIFSAATLDMAAGIEDYRGSAGISYASSKTLWSLSHLKSVSKVSGAASFITSLGFSLDINQHWRLRFRAGSQDNADKTVRIAFGGAGFAYSW